MSFENAQVLEAACIIRPLLPTDFDLDGNGAEQMDTQLANILNETNLATEVQVDQLLEILDSNPQTKAWLNNFLDAEKLVVEKGFSGLPGNPELPLPRKYGCPDNDYIWYQEGNREVPLCPTHLIPLSLLKS
jgi:hypothetical protein